MLVHMTCSTTASIRFVRRSPASRLAVIVSILLLGMLTTPAGVAASGRRSIVWLDPSAVVTFPGGWSVAACNEFAPTICVDRDGRRVGFIEAGASPVSLSPDPDLAARHPRRFLRDRAEEAIAANLADRAEGCGPDYEAASFGPRASRVMGHKGINFGHTGNFAGQPMSELVIIDIAIIEDHVVSINASAHDPEGCIGGDEELFTVEDLRDFRRHLRTLVANMPAPTFLWERPVSDAEGAVAYSVGDDTFVADADGAEVAHIGLLEKATLDGNVVAGIGPGGGAGIALGISTNAYDVTTGEQIWTALHTRAAIVLDEGRRAALLPDVWGQRDPQVNSIWMREEDGSERLVVQFANGETLPGYDPGFEGDNTLLSVSFDKAATVAVVTQGNDVSLFIYDIFAVDVATGEVTRLTEGKRSRAGSVSPDGTFVAYGLDKGSCGLDHIRAADLMLIGIDGSNDRLLASGSCEQWYQNPRWVSASEIVVYDVVPLASGAFDVDLVVIDVESGRITPLTDNGDTTYFTADADNNRVAYGGSDTTRFTLVDLNDGWQIEVENAGQPRLAGDYQWP